LSYVLFVFVKVKQCLSLNRAQRPSASDSARALAELLRKKRDSVYVDVVFSKILNSIFHLENMYYSKKTTELRKSTSSESVSAS